VADPDSSARDEPSLAQRAEQFAETAAERVRDAVKPRLRGWLHTAAFPVAVVAGVVLVVVVDGTRARMATAVYALTAALLFGTSALYHRGTWSPHAHGVLQRLDHANIFLIIAGTYTPFTLLLLDGGQGRVLLWGVWAAALAGVAFRVLWVGAPRWLYTPVYIALGWAAVFYLPELHDAGGLAVLVLLVLGGVLYSIGALVYAARRPDPSPHWFGFHEVFHSFTLGAYAVHYVAVFIAAHSYA
jgi:hemolysin III